MEYLNTCTCYLLSISFFAHSDTYKWIDVAIASASRALPPSSLPLQYTFYSHLYWMEMNGISLNWKMFPFTLAFKYMCTLFIHTKLIAVLPPNTDLEGAWMFIYESIYAFSMVYLLLIYSPPQWPRLATAACGGRAGLSPRCTWCRVWCSSHRSPGCPMVRYLLDRVCR